MAVAVIFGILFFPLAARTSTITAISPRVGSTNGNTRVTIEGTGFDIRSRSNDVYIGSGLQGVFCDPIPNEGSDTRIVCVTDSFRASGALPLSVRSFGMLATCRLANQTDCTFEYSSRATPIITSIFPQWISAGTHSGEITVTGRRFTQGDVTVGNFDFTMHLGEEERCELIGQVSFSTFRCRLEAGMRPGSLSVDVTLGASGRATIQQQRSILLLPTISDVRPKTGSIAGGTLLTVFGTSFSREALSENHVLVHGSPCIVTEAQIDRLLCVTAAHSHTDPSPPNVWNISKAKLEIWLHLPGMNIDQHWIGRLEYLQPTEMRFVPSFDLDDFSCTDCAVQLTGYVKAPVDGTYFLVADDGCNAHSWEMWVSDDTTPVTRRQQAGGVVGEQVLDVTPFNTHRVSHGSCTQFSNERKNATAISLLAGERRWMRVYAKHGKGTTLRIRPQLLRSRGDWTEVVSLSGTTLLWREDYVPPVSVVVRGIPALVGENCLPFGACWFQYSHLITPAVHSVLPTTATPGTLLTLVGERFSTGSVDPGALGSCLGRGGVGCGKGGCACPTNQLCFQQDHSCSWTGTSCAHTTQPPCTGWSLNNVTVGGSSCGVTFASSTQIVCELGYPAASGSLPIVVSVHGIGFASSAPTVSVSTTVRKIDPATGSINGGNRLTILGHSFDTADGASSVKVGPTSCALVETSAEKMICAVPAGIGSQNVILTTQSRSENNAPFLFTYNIPLRRPGTTKQSAVLTMTPQFVSLSGGQLIAIAGPFDVAPTSKVTVIIGKLQCRVVFALGNQVTCTSPATTSPGVHNATLSVTHFDGVIETVALPQVHFRRSILSIENQLVSTAGGGIVSLHLDGSPIQRGSVSISILSRQCFPLDTQPSNTFRCLVQPAPIAPPTFTPLQTLAFSNDGNSFTNVLGQVSSTGDVVAYGDGTVRIFRGANFVMTKKRFIRPFVFRSRVIVSQALAEDPRHSAVVMRVCVNDAADESDGYRVVAGATSDGKFAIRTSTMTSTTTHTEFEGSFEFAGLDPTQYQEWKVVATKSFIRFFIDDTLIHTLKDNSIQSGSVGFGFSQQDVIVDQFFVEDWNPYTVQINVSGIPVFSAHDVVYGAGATLERLVPVSFRRGAEITVTGTNFGSGPHALFALSTSQSTITEETPKICDGSLVRNRLTGIATFQCTAGGDLFPGSHHVALRSGIGQSMNTVVGEFSLSVVSIEPRQTAVNGRILTIHGGGFQIGVQARVNSQACRVLSLSSSKIICAAPPVQAGIYGVDVNGESCPACTITYDASLRAPQVNEVSPTGVSPGQTLTFIGSNFDMDTQIWVGNLTCQVVQLSTTMMGCVVGPLSNTGSHAILVHVPHVGFSAFSGSSTVRIQSAAYAVSPSASSLHGGAALRIRAGGLATTAGAGAPIAAWDVPLQGLDRNWSSAAAVKQCGEERFLGLFGNEDVFRQISGLGAHSAVRVSFRLFLNGATVSIRLWGPLSNRSALVIADPTSCHFGPACGQSDAATCVSESSFIVPHTSQAATLVFRGQGARDSNGWGIISYAVQPIRTLRHVVTVGGADCPITLVTPNAIHCTTPAGAGTSNVRVAIGSVEYCSNCTHEYSGAATPNVERAASITLPGAESLDAIPVAGANGVQAAHTAGTTALSKVHGANSWDGGGFSPIPIASGMRDGAGFQFQASSGNVDGVFGIALDPYEASLDQGTTHIDFAIALSFDGRVAIHERGSLIVAVGTFQESDNFTIRYNEGCECIHYIQNDGVLFASTVEAQFRDTPLFFDSSINTGTSKAIRRLRSLQPRESVAVSRLVVVGTGFAPGSGKIVVNGIPCRYTYFSHGQASCWIEHTVANAATWTFVVDGSALGKSDTNAAPLSPTLLASSAFPREGSVNGGHSVTIVGAGFSSQTIVTFGSLRCTNVVVVSTTLLTCQTPPSSAAEVVPTVSTGGVPHQCVAGLELYAPEAVTGCLPYVFSQQRTPSMTSVSGFTGSHSVVTIHGQNFPTIGGAAVSVGTAGCDIVRRTPTAVVCTVGVVVHGSHQLSVVFDSVGSASVAAGSSVSVVVPLTVTWTSTLITGTNGGATITIRGTGFGDRNDTVTLSVSGTSLCSSIAGADTELRCTTVAGTFSAAPLIVTVSGVSSIAPGGNFVSGANPIITAVLPTSGGRGSSLTISGANLGMGVVRIGDAKCKIFAATSTSAVCTIEDGTASGSLPMSITTVDRGRSGTTGVNFNMGLRVSDISPYRGRESGGTIVTIYGSGFSSTASENRVIIAGSPCTVVSSTVAYIICNTTNSSTDSRNDVQVSVMDGTSTQSTAATQYAYSTSLTATVTSIAPASGSAAGLEHLTITGSGFDVSPSNNVVRVGGALCSVESVAADGTSLTCLSRAMPIASANLVDVTINNIGKAASAVTFNAQLSVSAVSGMDETGVSVEGGLRITFHGNGFLNVPNSSSWQHKYFNLRVGSVSCPIVSATPTAIVCMLPPVTRSFQRIPVLVAAYPARPNQLLQPVSLIVNGVTASVPTSVTVSYTIAATPQVFSVTPLFSSPLVNPGAVLTILGSGFASFGNSVTAGRASCRITSESSTRIECTVGSDSFGAGFVRVLAPLRGWSGVQFSCPEGEFLMCDGTCRRKAQCSVEEWGVDTCTDLAHLILDDTFCHSNGGTDRVNLPFRTDTDDAFNLNCPMYSCEGGDCNQSLYIGGHGGVVSTCGNDPTGPIIDVRPDIAAISRLRSPIGGQAAITVSGAFFTSRASDIVVVTNGVVCAVVSLTPSQFVCNTGPTDHPSSGVLQVFVNGTQATCSSQCAFQYTDDNLPEIFRVEPNVSNIRTGGLITLRGSNFGTQPAVRVDDLEGLEIVDHTQFTIVCRMPQLSLGTHRLRVSVPSVGAGPAFTLDVPFVVQRVSGTGGSRAGGHRITISGTGFTTSLRLSFGECPTNFERFSSGAVVVVTLPCSPQTPTQALRFHGVDGYVCEGVCHYTYTVSQTPVVEVQSVAGSSLSLRVRNVENPGRISVLVGHGECRITFASVDTVACQLPSDHLGGKYWVRIVDASRGSSAVPHDGSGIAFTSHPAYTFPFSISSFSPASGSRGGGQTLSIVGSGFTQVAEHLRVTIGGVPCVVTSSTTVLVVCETGQSTTAQTAAISVASRSPEAAFDSTATSSTATYAYDNTKTPVVSAIVPNRGSTAGGTQVTISGTGLSSAFTVRISGVECSQSAAQKAQTNAASGSALYCTTGAHRTMLLPSRVQVDTGVDGDAYTTNVYQYVDLWSRWTTWGGNPPPVTGDSVALPEGTTVLVDYSPPQFYLVIVMGHLLFDNDIDIAFDCTFIMINFGRLTIGTPDAPYLKKATITLHGDRLTPEIPVHGSKVIALRHGALDIHGEVRRPTWTHLSATAAANSSTISVKGPVDWRVGEFIVVAPTSFDFLEAEHRMIIGVSPANGQAPTVVLQLEYPLDFEHFGVQQCYGFPKVCVNEIAEVGLLTRNIVVQGDRNTARLGFGGTMFLMPLGASSNKYARLSYVEFRQVGQQFIVGRYPVHFHVTHECNNSYVNGTSVHHSLNRAFSIHGISNNTYVNNVAYDIAGHAFFIEDGSEKFNVIHNNMVALTRTSTSNLNTDVTPANFWIVSPSNTITHNAACGSFAYGFWIAPFHPHSTGPTHSTQICPATHRLIDISFNVAHSCHKYGLNIFQFWWPKRTECDFDGPDFQAVIRSHVSYKNMIHGVTSGNQEVGQVGAVLFDNLTSADNGMTHGDGSAFWVENINAANMTFGIQNSVLIAETGNQNAHDRLHPRAARRRGVNLPEGDNFFSENITFVNYHGLSHAYEPQAWAQRNSLCFPWGWEAVSRGLRWIDSPNRILFRFHHHGILNDDDGTLTGTSGTQILPASPMLDTQICTSPSAEASAARPWRTSLSHVNTVSDALLCPNSYKIRRFGIGSMSDVWGKPEWKIHNRTELILDIFHQYLVTAPVNNTVEIDFRNWKNPNSFDWSFGGSTFMQPGERMHFWTRYNETRHHVYASFNNKPLDKEWDVARPLPLSQQQLSGYSFDNVTMELNVALLFPESSRVEVSAFDCPDQGCPLPPIPPQSWWNDCKPYEELSSWQSTTLPVEGEELSLSYAEVVCLTADGAHHVSGTGGRRQGRCTRGTVYTYNFFSLTLEGALKFFDEHCPCDGAVLHLRVSGWIWLRQGGIIVGNETSPLTRCRFRLSILQQPDNAVETNSIYANPPWGNRGISLESGIFQLHSQAPSPHFTRLRETVERGSRTLRLTSSVLSWWVGAKIVVAGAGRRAMYSHVASEDSEWEHSETRTIVSISSDGRELELDEDLQYTHPGHGSRTLNGVVYEVGVEVAILSRTITVDGGSSSEFNEPGQRGWQLNAGCTPWNYLGCAAGPPSEGGWPMGIGKPGWLRIDGVHFKDLGQATLQHGAIDIDGLNDQVDASTSFIRNSVLERVYNTAIFVRHTTTGFSLLNNTIYRVAGDGVRIAGPGNSVIANLVVRVGRPFRVCDEGSYSKMTAGFLDCVASGFRVHAATQMLGNIVASGITAGFLTEGDRCDMELNWTDNRAHSVREGILVVDEPGDPWMNWATGQQSPKSCRKVGGVLVFWISDHGLIAWYASGDLKVEAFVSVQSTIGVAAILMYPPASRLREAPSATYENLTVSAAWPGLSGCGQDLFLRCKKSLLDGSPFCSMLYGRQGVTIGQVGILQTVFTSSELGLHKTKGEKKFRFIETDTYATITGQAWHRNIFFDEFSRSDDCGFANAAFFQNIYSNDTFHHHRFERVTWGPGMRSGHVFTRRLYGDSGVNLDGDDVFFLDFDQPTYGAYWPDAPNRMMLIDIDGTFSTGFEVNPPANINGTSHWFVVASETITRPVRMSEIGWDGRGFRSNNLPPPLPGCSWMPAWEAFRCDGRFRWVTLAIENLSEDRLTRRTGPVVLCKGDGMVDAAGMPLCQEGTTDIASGPVMKGKVQRATLDRLSRYWLYADVGGNYTLSFRGQPPTWMKLQLTDFEYLGSTGVNASIVVNLRYFGLNSQNRVVVFVDGRRMRPNIGYGYPFEQIPAQEWPSPSDPPGTHYHDKYVDDEIRSAGQGLQRNVLSVVVKAGATVELKAEPVVQVNAELSMPEDAFFNEKDTFIPALASTLGVSEERMKIVEVTPGTTRRRQGSTTRISVQISQSDSASESNYRRQSRPGTEINDLRDVASSANAFAANPEAVNGVQVTNVHVEEYQVSQPVPPIRVREGTPYLILNISRYGQSINTTVLELLVAVWLRRNLPDEAPFNDTDAEDVGVGNAYEWYNSAEGVTRVAILLIYDVEDMANCTANAHGLGFLFAALNGSIAREAIFPGFTVHEVDGVYLNLLDCDWIDWWGRGSVMKSVVAFFGGFCVTLGVGLCCIRARTQTNSLIEKTLGDDEADAPPMFDHRNQLDISVRSIDDEDDAVVGVGESASENSRVLSTSSQAPGTPVKVNFPTLGGTGAASSTPPSKRAARAAF